MNAITINLISSVIFAIAGWIGNYIYRKNIILAPDRRLWKFGNNKNVTVILSHSTATITEAYSRPSTGLGQVCGLVTLAESIVKAFGNVNFSTINLSSDPIRERIEDDLIIIGGPKTNNLTKEFIEHIQEKQPLNQVGSIINWSMFNAKPEIYEGKAVDGSVVTDYGYIIRTRNFKSSKSNRYAYIFAGSHTYGTMAATKYFTANLKFDKKLLKNERTCYAILIQADVRDGHPQNFRLIHKHEWI
jgi:hypothetical protein